MSVHGGKLLTPDLQLRTWTAWLAGPMTRSVHPVLDIFKKIRKRRLSDIQLLLRREKIPCVDLTACQPQSYRRSFLGLDTAHPAKHEMIDLVDFRHSCRNVEPSSLTRQRCGKRRLRALESRCARLCIEFR